MIVFRCVVAVACLLLAGFSLWMLWDEFRYQRRRRDR